MDEVDAARAAGVSITYCYDLEMYVRLSEKAELDRLLQKFKRPVEEPVTEEELNAVTDFASGDPPVRIKTKVDGLLSVWRLWFHPLCF